MPIRAQARVLDVIEEVIGPCERDSEDSMHCCDMGECYDIFLDRDDGTITITYFDESEEIKVPEALAQHYEIPEELEEASEEELERYMKKLDERAKREIKKWEEKPPKVIDYDGSKIVISHVVVPRECYVNIPHYHYYKGFECVIPYRSLRPEELEDAVKTCLREMRY